ncbi:MAG: substrate-binding domain-containing protein [Verrucomicrobiota bacterium]
MSDSRKKETIKLSFDQKERALAVLRALIRSNYFGDHIPDDAAISRMLRIPRSSLLLAINTLTAQNVMQPSTEDGGWEVIRKATVDKMGTVAFVVNTDALTGWQSLFQDWLIGFEEIMFQERYDVQILYGFTSVEEKIQAISKFRADGGMGCVLASRTEPAVRRHVIDSDIPAVILGNATMHDDELGTISNDDSTGVHQAIDFLIERNHRNISMYATGLSMHDGYDERYHAYQRAMRQHHLAAHSELAFSEAHNDLTARRAADVILRMKRRPTAILCASDREAFELVSELRHLEIKIPEDISIMGFDNNYFGTLLDPPMTTVDIYAPNMGQIAANYLLNEMQAPQLPIKILTPTEIIIRASVAELDQKHSTHEHDGPLNGESGRILSF